MAEERGLLKPKRIDFAELLRQAAQADIKPREFWGMTFREFALYTQGRAQHVDLLQYLAALVASWIINAIPKFRSSPAATPDRLLGRGSKRPFAEVYGDEGDDL